MKRRRQAGSTRISVCAVALLLLYLAGCSDKHSSTTSSAPSNAPVNGSAVAAHDLQKNDPERQEILDAVRKIEASMYDVKDVKFVVKDLIRDGDAAYVCALTEVDGQMARTDDSFNVGHWALLHQPDGWHVIDLGDGLADSPHNVDCRVSNHVIVTRSDIANAIADARHVESDAPPRIGDDPPIVPRAAISEDQAVSKVLAAIKRRQLTSLKPECLDLYTDGADERTFSVDVHERHNAQCGGDPQTSPRLFSFEVNKATGAMMTDALSDDRSEMEPIQ
ncbi:hypothetical protein [Burkholderia sp. LMG 32019]|uniref:hypothetical protein n=1 Tax=Burkholderia sp. LMG 32019 TaxID=3158173 RepID=UPI003C2C071D